MRALITAASGGNPAPGRPTRDRLGLQPAQPGLTGGLCPGRYSHQES